MPNSDKPGRYIWATYSVDIPAMDAVQDEHGVWYVPLPIQDGMEDYVE